MCQSWRVHACFIFSDANIPVDLLFLGACILFNYFTSTSSLRRSIHELPRKESFLLISLKMNFVLKKTLPSIANRSAEHLAKLQFQIKIFFGGEVPVCPIYYMRLTDGEKKKCVLYLLFKFNWNSLFYLANFSSTL